MVYIAVGGDCRPAGKCHEGRPFGCTADPEDPGGVELHSEELGLPHRSALAIEGIDVQNRVLEAKARLLAEVEIGAGVEDLQARQQQEEHRHRPDPVRDPGHAVLPVDQARLAFTHAPARVARPRWRRGERPVAGHRTTASA